MGRACLMVVRSRFTAGGPTHFQKTLGLGRRLARQQRHSLLQPGCWRKGRLDLWNVDQRKKFKAPDQKCAFSKRQSDVIRMKITQ